ELKHVVRRNVPPVRPRVNGDAVRAGVQAQLGTMNDAGQLKLRPGVPQRRDFVDVDGKLGHTSICYRARPATSSINSRGQPMSATVISPVYCFDAGLAKPVFSATKVMVRVARTQAPSGSPVSQSIPLGK